MYKIAKELKQMKKIVVLLMVVGVLVSFSACKGKEVSNNGAGDKGTNIEAPKENEQEENNETDNKAEDKEDNTDGSDNSEVVTEGQPKEKLLKSAYEGKIDGIEFGIGDKGTDIIGKMGEPDESDYFLGGFYLSYDDIMFLTNGYDETGKVVSILFFDKNAEVFGIKLGLTTKEIEKVLGTADEVISAKDNEQSELYMDNWTTRYKLGSYELTFVHEDKDGPVEWFSLWQK